MKLFRFGVGSAGHSGQFAVHAEIVLEGDGGQGLVLIFNLDPFLGLDGLMQAVRPAPSRHKTTGKLINDHYFAVFHHIIHIKLVHGMGPQSLIDMMQDFDIARVVQVVYLKQFFDFKNTLLGQGLRSWLFHQW